MKKKILVVAAHPDDEVLGCGGTIAKHAQAGDEVHVLIMAEGLTSRDAKRDATKRKSELSDLVLAAKKANKVLGVRSLSFEAFPDNRMDSVDRLDIVKAIEVLKKKIGPSVVYTHHGDDVNIDHRCVHDAVTAACRPQPGECVKTLLFFETPSSTEWQTRGKKGAFAPNWYEDVSSTLKVKLKALKAYHSEMRPWPHARSYRAIESLARWRGSSVGTQAAEAFVLGRNSVGEKK
jgi:LmbE family N-acetylglucosaminyl deacetylase